MKPYLVDVPVMLMVFVRPDTLRRVFNVIKEARPSMLFLVSDGPREHIPTDREKIDESRKIVEEIDWDCKLKKLYFDTNQGLYKTTNMSYEFVFKYVDRCIFLEDDVETSVSFFRFCADLLEKYKDDTRMYRICGMNHLGVYKETDKDYFFSREGSIWGYAIWKRTFNNFDGEYSFRKDKYVMDRLEDNSPKWIFKKANGYAHGEMVDGHVAGPEFFFNSTPFLHNQLNIVATKNMVCNIGCTADSAHSADNIRKLTKNKQQLFYMRTYEYEFPLRHQQFVIVDKLYEKKVDRIMVHGHPLEAVFRRFEILVRQAVYGDWKVALNMIVKKIKKTKTIER